MQIKNMFEKQIDRDIKGVIKVGQSDEENVYQELDEYVVTKELLKHFRDFFNNYEKGVDGYTDKFNSSLLSAYKSAKDLQEQTSEVYNTAMANDIVDDDNLRKYYEDITKAYGILGNLICFVDIMIPP